MSSLSSIKDWKFSTCELESGSPEDLLEMLKFYSAFSFVKKSKNLVNNPFCLLWLSYDKFKALKRLLSD